MPLFIASLNSGSNGNCYYVGNHDEAILVDAGISCREIEQRMGILNLKLESVKGIFISHEHIDHIRGVSVLSKKLKIPVYISEKTLRHSGIRIAHELLNHFDSDESIELGQLNIIPFTKMHDANDPFSFIIEGEGIRIGVITDVGSACKRVVHYFRQCHACFLESNYDEVMLEEGGYPLRLKKRISGGQGHLSNLQALDLFLNHRSSFLSHLILSHLSKNNNHPEIVMDLFSKNSGSTTIVIASRDTTSDVFEIRSELEHKNVVRKYSEKKYVQLKLVI
jgi:phosphoribosyl 1,2-cyclic phosphodiesterase